jgi:uracil-DNA glycosylase family 4
MSVAKPQKCVGCPLYGAPGPVWGEGIKPNPLAIIGQNPGPQEIQEHRPFVGASGSILNRTLQKVGISRQGSYVTNVVKCYVKPGSSVPPAAVHHCKRAFLDEEIKELKPRVVLTLGQEAFDALCSPKHLALIHTRQSAKNDPSYWLAGAPYPHPLGFTVVGAAHPAFVARTGFALLPKLEKQVSQALNIMMNGTPQKTEVEYKYDPTDQEVREYIPYMLSHRAGGCDIETTYRIVEEDEEAEKYEENKVLEIGLAANVNSYLSVKPDQFHLLGSLFHPYDGRTPLRLWCYGAQTEFHYLSRMFEGNPGVQWADAMLAFHLLWPDEVSKDLGTAMALYSRWGYHKNLEHRDPIWYNVQDTVGCLEIGEAMYTELSGLPIPATELFWSLCECVPEVLAWQHDGCPYNQEASDLAEYKLAKALERYELFWNTKFPLTSWSSPKQLIGLFDTLGFKAPMKNRVKKDKKTGQTIRTRTPSMDEEALEKIAAKGSAIAKLIILMRQLRKSGDFCNLAERGRLRTRAKIHGQAGGRIQTVDKNLQQIPEEMMVDPKVDGSGIFPREQVVPEHEDDIIVAADFSQIEFWLYAYYSRCQKLIDIKDRGEYLYGDFYEGIWNEPFFLPGVPRTKGNRDDSITPPWKLLVAKSWPLGFIYGRGVPGVEGLPITPARAKQLRADFFSSYPEIGTYHNKLMFTASKQGFLQTPFGRLRRFANPEAQRNALLAFPGQSTAPDILIQKVILEAGRNVARLFGSRSRLYFTVHDSGIFNIHGGRKDRQLGVDALNYIATTMSSPIPELDGFSIPCEAKIGPNWGRLYSAEKYLNGKIATAST